MCVLAVGEFNAATSSPSRGVNGRFDVKVVIDSLQRGLLGPIGHELPVTGQNHSHGL